MTESRTVPVSSITASRASQQYHDALPPRTATAAACVVCGPTTKNSVGSRAAVPMHFARGLSDPARRPDSLQLRKISTCAIYLRTAVDFRESPAGTPHAMMSDLRARASSKRTSSPPQPAGCCSSSIDINHVLQSPALFSSRCRPSMVPEQLLAEQRRRTWFIDPPAGIACIAGLVDQHPADRAGGLREPAGARTRRRRPRRGPATRQLRLWPIAMQLPTRVVCMLWAARRGFRAGRRARRHAGARGGPELPARPGFVASGLLMQYGTGFRRDRREPRDSLTMTLLGSEAEGAKVSDVDFGASSIT